MEGHGHDHGEEKDEHVWLSLKNAKTLVGAIADALQKLDPDNKDTYAANASAYIEKLSEMCIRDSPWAMRSVPHQIYVGHELRSPPLGCVPAACGILGILSFSRETFNPPLHLTLTLQNGKSF